MLAELGYVAFAADMYGDNRVTTHAKDAKAWSSQIAENQAAWQQRALAGLDVLKSQVQAFRDALTAAGADWQMAVYGGAKHSFTNPEADSFGIDGVAYDAKADARSWALMKDFLAGVLAP